MFGGKRNYSRSYIHVPGHYWSILQLVTAKQSQQKITATWMLLCLIVGQIGLITFPTRIAEAAQVTIDNTVSTNSQSHTQGQPSSVFISDQVGYKFYRDSTGICVYRKTTNGGTSWGGVVTVDAQTDCESVQVWYDKWTPGDTGPYIHIGTLDSGNDDIWYNRLDTTSDTLLLGSAPVSVVLSQSPLTISAATAGFSLAKSTTGILYVSLADSSDRFVVSCSVTCQTSGNWTEVGDGTFMDLDEDLTILIPLDSGNMMLINRDISADDIRTKIWNGSSWSASWTNIDITAPENTTYDVGMSAVRSPVNGDIYLAYIADNNNYTVADHDIRLARYSGGSWSSLADYTTNDTRGLTSIALSIDANTNDVYMAYSARTTLATAATGQIYYATSTNGMTSWGSENGPVNTASGDIYGVDFNYFSDERLYLTWYESALDDIFGDTILNTSPITVVSSFSSQQSEVRASTTDFYVGGTFVIKENIATRNVTNLTITENGTVDAANGLKNIKIQYDLDTTAPYDCASESYGGGESQFGSTDTNGFSGSNGVSSFSGSVGIATTTAMCAYVVLDVEKAAADGSTIDIEISNPETDVIVSGGVTAIPTSPVVLTGDTTIVDSDLTQTHYHWRNDNNTETLATSRTAGVQDTPAPAIQQSNPVRLRLGVSNEGSTTSLPTTLRLEYAQNISTCDVATGWVDVGATSDAWDMSNSTFVTDGTNTTDISNAIGGVDNENTVFLTPNGGQKDTSSTVGSLTFQTNNWTEVEFAIVATVSAIEGNSYCFRLTNAGEPLSTYTNYPLATIAADVTVSATGTQAVGADVPTTDAYFGGTFVIKENSGARNVTDITISENGTVDASLGLNNIKLFYDLDTSNPYNCVSESYSGGESQFGSTDTDGFSSANGSSTFSGTVGISTTSSMCVYVVADVTGSANNGETVNLLIESGSVDVVVSDSGSVAPATPIDIAGETTLAGAIVTQTHYHWRNDDGDETASGATSATGGLEDTPVENFSKDAPIRLRIGLSNEGSTSSVPRQYGLEYGIKSSTCDAISVWTDADGAGISWNMFDSVNLTNGSDTTNITLGSGGVSDPGGKTFLGTNGGVSDTDSFSATTTLTSSQFTELEYSITSTEDTPYETNFCFRVTQNGEPLLAYSQYAEISIESKRDFKTQTGTSTVSGTGVTLVAGVNYDAPLSSTTAFVRITNSHYTGAGKDTLGGNQNTDDYAAYIVGPVDLQTSFTIARDTDSINNTFVGWEIVEYIGDPGGDNEIIVRSQDTVSYASTDTTATGTAVSLVADDTDVVVFITGQFHNGGNRTITYAHQSTSDWNDASNEPIFQRGASGSTPGIVSYAVVEFVGLNWKIQRAEHSYTAVNTPETEVITPVNSLNRAFLHTQKRYGVTTAIADVGHDVFFSGIGAITFQLDPTATIGTNPVSVAWVIENTQSGTGAMQVIRSSGPASNTPEPVIQTVTITPEVNAANNASIFFTTTVNQVGNNMPRALAAAYITSSSTYQIWRSEASGVGDLTYRTDIVQWPAADLSIRQNYYRFYDDNNALLPTDAWPPGVSNLGENESITSVDEPLADTEHIRIRMTARINNASLPAGLLTVKLQYGVQTGTCSAVTVWNDVGAPGSGEIWRGYDAPGISSGVSLSSDPPGGGDLLISLSDVAGRYSESDTNSANQYKVVKGEDLEYDWHIQQNGATQKTYYCFRMVKVDDTELDGYLNYPLIRTEGYTPVTQNWQWFDDETNETPSTALASENVTPTDIDKGNIVKLRVTINEIKNLPQVNARFRLQYSESPSFTFPTEVVASSSCTSDSVWCYADGAGIDNELITTKVLSDSDVCAVSVGDGCGVHVESADVLGGFSHNPGLAIENEFTLQYTNVVRNFGKVYYFRVYDSANDEPVAVNSGSSIPSIAGESARLTFSVAGLPAETVTAGILTDATTTATAITFGSLPFDTEVEAAQRLTVVTNATDGFQVLKFASQDPLNSYGDPIPAITSSNAAPLGWNASCLPAAIGCFGYHTTDATLQGGSGRFAPTDSYAALSTTAEEVMYSSIPTTDVQDIVFKAQVGALQPAGDYETNIVYIVVPVY